MTIPARLRLSAAAALLLLGALLRAEEAPVPLSLDEAKAAAVRNHPRYAAAQLQAFLAQQALREARAGYYPTANGFLDAVGAHDEGTRILAGGLNNPSVYDRASAGVAVSELLTDFGRTANLNAGARAQARSAEAGAESTREQVILNAETSYFAALQAQSVLRVAQQTLGSRKLVLDQVQALAGHQLKSALDVSFAQVAYEQAELLVQQSQGQEEAAMAALSTALGYPDARSFVLADAAAPPAAPADAQGLVAAALKDRPDLRQLRDQRDAAQSQAYAERDANYPTLSAVGTAGTAAWRDPHLPPNYAVAGVQLSVPLFAGGAYLARQREAELRARIAEETLRQAQDEAAREVRTAWIGLRTALQRWRTTGQLVRHADDAFNLAQARYQAGSSSVVELSEAQLSQTAAAIAQAQARYDTLIQQAVLDYQSGALR